MYNIYIHLILFVIGVVFGSFFNVLGLRVPNNESIIKPRSHCVRCGHVLKFFELIPVLSFIFLRGRCRNCKEKISFIYPIIELLTGILFVLCYKLFGFSFNFVIGITLSSLFVLVCISDYKYLIIPDSFIIISSIIIIICKAFSSNIYEFLFSIGSGLAAFLVMYLIMYLGSILFKKECLGGADVKLMFVAGMVLDPFLAMIVICLASFIALPVSLYLLLKNKEHVIPFGPFIMISIMIVFMLGLNFDKIINFFVI